MGGTSFAKKTRIAAKIVWVLFCLFNSFFLLLFSHTLPTRDRKFSLLCVIYEVQTFFLMQDIDKRRS